MKKFLILLLAFVFCAGFTACGNNGKDDDNDGGDDIIPQAGVTFEDRAPKLDGQLYTGGNLTYPSSLWQAPEYAYDSSLDPTNIMCGGVKAFFMDSPVKYNNKPTKIMGYIGFPAGASAANKVPGIVLVHGGLGTAYPDWVKMWNDRGYAAVSIDTEGGQAKPANMMYSGLHDERNKYASDAAYTAGPTNSGFVISGGIENVENSWMYHATSSVILANSLLRADERVNADKVGITGISWGGIVTNIVIGYDDRFAFAMPVYGSVGLDGSSAQFNSFPSELSRQTWDTLEPMKLSTTPILWVNSNKDFAFALDATTKCYKAGKNSFLAIKNNLSHGQDLGANPGELAVFADAVTGKDNQIIKITQNPTKGVPVLKYTPGSDVTVNSIKLWYITDLKLSSSAVWDSVVLEPAAGNTINISYPGNASYCYVTFVYNNNLVISSGLVKLI